MELNHRLLHVGQVSSPLDHGIVFSVTEVGVEPTESRGSRPRRFSCLRTRPLCRFGKWRVRESHPAVKAYEAPKGTGAPASIGSAIGAEKEYCKLQVPVSNRADRSYESQLSTCSPAMTRAGFEPASPA